MDKYISANALKRDLIANRSFFPAIVAKAIEAAPAVDAVEVVRCKDCKHFDTCDFDGDVLVGCMNLSGLTDVSPNGFCSYGKRREQE